MECHTCYKKPTSFCSDCFKLFCSDCIVIRKHSVECAACYINKEECLNKNRICTDCNQPFCNSLKTKFKKIDLGDLNEFCIDCIDDYGRYNCENIDLCEKCIKNCENR